MGKDLELVTSPTSNSLLKGEVNLLRYFSRRFNLFNIGSLTDKEIDSMENTFDLIHSELWSSGQVNTMIENLMGKKEPQFLVNKKFSPVDVLAMAIFSNTKKPNNLAQNYVKKCQAALTQGNFLITFLSAAYGDKSVF